MPVKWSDNLCFEVQMRKFDRRTSLRYSEMAAASMMPHGERLAFGEDAAMVTTTAGKVSVSVENGINGFAGFLMENVRGECGGAGGGAAFGEADVGDADCVCGEEQSELQGSAALVQLRFEGEEHDDL
jgi:hypothetical protein